jgi:hypothetical protein
MKKLHIFIWIIRIFIFLAIVFLCLLAYTFDIKIEICTEKELTFNINVNPRHTGISGIRVNYPMKEIRSKLLCVGDENLIWDTGSSQTLFLENINNHKRIFLGYISQTDVANILKKEKVYFSPVVKLSSFTAKNIMYIQMDKQDIVILSKATGINVEGIIGMDLIGTENWLIDFENSTMQILPQNEMLPLMSELCVNYNDYNMLPTANFAIQNIEIDSVLIDSGTSDELFLYKSDIDKINIYIAPVDSGRKNYSGLYSNRELCFYIYRNITVNGYLIDKLQITVSDKRILGLGFFHKFSKVFLDTKKQEFQFYK